MLLGYKTGNQFQFLQMICTNATIDHGGEFEKVEVSFE